MHLFYCHSKIASLTDEMNEIKRKLRPKMSSDFSALDQKRTEYSDKEIKQFEVYSFLYDYVQYSEFF